MSGIKVIILTALLFPYILFSQTTGNRTVGITLPIVTLIDIEPAGNIVMEFTAPTDAGRRIIAPAPNASKWINYTCAIASGGITRRITASVNQVIPGVNIRLQTAAASGSGGGTFGIPTSTIILSTTAQTVISGIGGAFTGNGTNNGHLLTITLAPNTYANLSAISNIPVVITYTITE